MTSSDSNTPSVRDDGTYVCRDRNCGPMCDFCQWYRFNGDYRGAYVGEGQCVHPEHPHAEEPHGGCDDYVCAYWPEADATLRAEHRNAATGKPR